MIVGVDVLVSVGVTVKELVGVIVGVFVLVDVTLAVKDGVTVVATLKHLSESIISLAAKLFKH